MKIKRFFISLAVFMLVLLGFTVGAQAAVISEDYIDSSGARNVTVTADGGNDTILLRKILNDTAENALVLNFSAGDYHIGATLPVYDNTVINADGAHIYQDAAGKGILINARCLNGVQQGRGKYNSLNNVKINGGTWQGTSLPDTSKTLKSNGYYVGYSTFLFMHAQNISISNCAFVNNYNGHFVELAGVKNATVENCNMAVNGSVYVGEGSNEAIQIDNTYSKSNSPVGYPWDDTASKNITVKNCKIKYARGIGTNKNGNSFFENITIEKCNITSQNEGINIYDALGVKINKCTVKSKGKKDNYTSCGIYVGLESKLSKSKRKKSVTKISACTVSGYHAGLKVCVPKNNTKFGRVELKNNKFYSYKSKSRALYLSYNGKQITKLVKKGNTLKYKK